MSDDVMPDRDGVQAFVDLWVVEVDGSKVLVEAASSERARLFAAAEWRAVHDRAPSSVGSAAVASQSEWAFWRSRVDLRARVQGGEPVHPLRRQLRRIFDRVAPDVPRDDVVSSAVVSSAVVSSDGSLYTTSQLFRPSAAWRVSINLGRLVLWGVVALTPLLVKLGWVLLYVSGVPTLIDPALPFWTKLQLWVASVFVVSFVQSVWFVVWFVATDEWLAAQLVMYPDRQQYGRRYGQGR